MTTSEEYLASLGIDTSDVDRAVNQTITIIAHLGTQFDQVKPAADRAERALLGVAGASRTLAAAQKQTASAFTGGIGAMAAQMQAQLGLNAAAAKAVPLFGQQAEGQRVAAQAAGLLAQQQQAAGAAANGLSAGSLPRLRYALYDVSATAGLVSAALLALTATVIGFSAAYERAFTNVQRTSDSSSARILELRQQLLELTRTSPVNFGDATGIATLGNQLGVAAGQIATFTKTVVEFSTITGVSTDEAAKSFGSLGNILGLDASQFSALASAIVLAGRRGVTTEAQILSLSREIAQQATSAGFAAQEVVGLSAALGDLRVPPERARGALTTYFQTLTLAVAQGGDQLKDFATVIGVTADQLDKMVRSGQGEEVFRRFIAALNDLDNVDATAALDRLGLAQLRVSDVFTRLSSNLDTYTKQQANAAQGFSEDSEQARQYALVVDDLASKFQILLNGLRELAATVGDAVSPAVKGAVDLMIAFVNATSDFLSTDFGATFAQAGVAIAVVVGVLTAGVSAAALFAASILAVRTAMLALTGSATAATVAVTVLKNTLIATGIGAAVVLIGTLIGSFLELGSAASKIDLTGVADALSKDREEYEKTGQAIRVWQTSISESSTTASDWVKSVEQASGAQVTLAGNTTTTTTAIKDQTVAYGENAKQALAAALANNEAFQNLFKGDTFANAGIDPGKLVSAILGDPQDAGVSYVTTLLNAVTTQLGTQTLDTNGLVTPEDLGLLDTKSALEQILPVVLGVKEAFGGQVAVMDAAKAVYDATGVSVNGLGGDLDGLDASAQSVGEQFSDLISTIFGATNAAVQQQQALMGMGQAFAESGADAAFAGQDVQTYIQSIIGAAPTAQAAADGIQVLINSIVASGYVSAANAPQLELLRQVVASLGGSSVKGTRDLGDFAQGMRSAGGAAAGAAAQVRTLVDYASDLRQVLSRAFDIRFGTAQGADDITKSWLAIRQAIEDTNDEIAQYEADMRSLTSDKAIREYWLSIAEAYGDALRAGVLRGEIAGIDQKLASTSKSLNTAQEKNSKTLTGNSKAAIDNREEILGLVKSYESYLTTLAASGVDQATLQSEAARLKQEFIAQATQLGYNADQLGIYASAFDDVSTAIASVPRNITVTANANPAIQALNEFQARLDQVRASAGQGISFPTPYIPSPHYEYLGNYSNNDDYRIVKRQVDLGYLAGYFSGRDFYRYVGTWKSGTAWTGSGNPNEIAGVVHNREAVLNEQATRMLGSQFINNANQGRQPMAPVIIRPGGGDSGSGITELGSATLRRLDEMWATLRVIIGDRELANAVDRSHASERSLGG